jgi:hypothetical protein
MPATFAAPELNSFIDRPFGSNLEVSDYTVSGVRILKHSAQPYSLDIARYSLRVDTWGRGEVASRFGLEEGL